MQGTAPGRSHAVSPSASHDLVEYPFHEGARSSLKIVAVLCFVLVAAAPLGIWLLIRAAGGKVRISRSGVVVKGLGSTSFQFEEVERLGVLERPIVARGIGGALVKRRVGGNHATYLVVKTTRGKTRSFIVSSYDNFRQIIDVVSERAGKTCERLTTGLVGVKWPERA